MRSAAEAMDDRVTIEIPMVVPRTLLSTRSWWRSQHNDRTVWRDRVRAARDAAGIGEHRAILCGVRVDWGKRRPWLDDAQRRLIVDEVMDALQPRASMALRPHVVEEQSGRGRGTTWIELQRV